MLCPAPPATPSSCRLPGISLSCMSSSPELQRRTSCRSVWIAQIVSCIVKKPGLYKNQGFTNPSVEKKPRGSGRVLTSSLCVSSCIRGATLLLSVTAAQLCLRFLACCVRNLGVLQADRFMLLCMHNHTCRHTAACAPPCRQHCWRTRRSAGHSTTMKHSCARHQQQLGAHSAAPASAWQQQQQQRARRLRCLVAAAAAEQVGQLRRIDQTGFTLSPVEVFCAGCGVLVGSQTQHELLFSLSCHAPPQPHAPPRPLTTPWRAPFAFVASNQAPSHWETMRMRGRTCHCRQGAAQQEQQQRPRRAQVCAVPQTTHSRSGS